MKAIIATALLAFASQSVMATNYYAAPDGTGDGTSYNSPCDIKKGISKLMPGDSLFLKGGQYDLSEKLTIKKAGVSAEKRTFIGAVPGEKPILDFRNQPHRENGVSVGADYIHLKGIVVRYAGFKGILNTGSYNLLEMLETYGNCDTGLQNKGGVSNVILNCDSHDNFDYMTGTIDNADWGGNADGFADKQHGASPGNTYIGCRAWRNSDDGWDFYQREGGPTTFINCICYANAPKEYDLSDFPRLKTDAAFLDQFAGEGITIITKKGMQVKCSLKHYYNNGNGNGFKIGGKNTKHNVRLYRCLAVANPVKGFDQNNNAGDIVIYNCSAYKNGRDYGFSNENGFTLDIKNCVSLASEKKNSLKGNVKQGHNSWEKGYELTEADFINLDESLILAPRKADGSLPDNLFMMLAPNSKAVDAGLKVEGVEFNGKAPDLGWQEK